MFKKHPLLMYFILAFAITWVCQIGGLLLAPNGMRLGNEANFLNLGNLLSGKLDGASSLALLIFALGLGPFIAAHIVTAACSGRAGLKELWGRILHWRVEPVWYGVVVLIPILQAGLALLIILVVLGSLGTYAPTLPLSSLPLFFLYMLIFTGLAEEPGWRGFALPRLQARYSAEKASLILGALWAVWHFPFMIYLYASTGATALISMLAGYTMVIIGWTIVNTWIYNSTRSVLLNILLHGISNTVNAYLIAVYPANSTLALVFSLLPWLLAIFLSRRLKPENLSRQARHQIK